MTPDIPDINPYKHPEYVPEEIRELPPMLLLTYVQRLADDEDHLMDGGDIATIADNLGAVDLGNSEAAE